MPKHTTKVVESQSLDSLKPIFDSDKAKLSTICNVLCANFNFFIDDDFDQLRQEKPELATDLTAIQAVCEKNQEAKLGVILQLFRELGLTKHAICVTKENAAAAFKVLEDYDVRDDAQNCILLLLQTGSLDMGIKLLRYGAFKYELNADNLFELRLNEDMVKMRDSLSQDQRHHLRLIMGCIIWALGDKMFQLEHTDKLLRCFEALKLAAEQRGNTFRIFSIRNFLIVVSFIGAILSWGYIFYRTYFFVV